MRAGFSSCLWAIWARRNARILASHHAVSTLAYPALTALLPAESPMVRAIDSKGIPGLDPGAARLNPTMVTGQIPARAARVARMRESTRPWRSSLAEAADSAMLG